MVQALIENPVVMWVGVIVLFAVTFVIAYAWPRLGKKREGTTTQ